MAESKKASRKAFQLEVPIDASEVGALADDERQSLRVVAVAGGKTVSSEVAISKAGKGKATLELPQSPTAVKLYVGPAAATDEEITQTQTLTVDIRATDVVGKDRLQLEPLRIPPYYWYWWLRWCREFVIRGKVVCPDGHPVPGAEVCASDVDRWLFWSSTQQVGCATTAADGTFEIRFRWCCGYWPWWWWRHRVWRFDPVIADRIQPHLDQDLLRDIGPIPTQPSLANLGSILPDGPSFAELSSLDPGRLDSIRRDLLARLPDVPDLRRLRIWPWQPWRPWWDCVPDIIFDVTQECDGVTQTIVDENVFDTRWNISNPLEVVLVADEACCVPPGDDGGDCLVVDGVCARPLATVAGNLGAPAFPEGYASGDRPFAGVVTITKNPGDLVGFDYYELEHRIGGGAWNPLPAGAELPFSRQYWEPAAATPMQYPLFSVLTMSGHRVYETREHRQAAIGGAWFPSAAWTKLWLSHNYSLLARLNSAAFADGTVEFRVVGWQEGTGGTLVNPVVIPVCGTQDDNRFVLTFDNRTVTALGHDPAHHCGSVHICTVEPDTHILAVRVNGNPVAPCAVTEAEGTLEIDFEVTDPDGHLYRYDLRAKYGLNGVQPLLGLGTLTSLSGDPVGPTYAAALGGGAVRPFWSGGRYRLRIENAADAFPIPCCYLLELRAWKRTIVGCGGDYDHWNRTEYSIGIGVC